MNVEYFEYSLAGHMRQLLVRTFVFGALLLGCRTDPAKEVIVTVSSPESNGLFRRRITVAIQNNSERLLKIDSINLRIGRLDTTLVALDVVRGGKDVDIREGEVVSANSNRRYPVLMLDGIQIMADGLYLDFTGGPEVIQSGVVVKYSEQGPTVDRFTREIGPGVKETLAVDVVSGDYFISGFDSAGHPIALARPYVIVKGMETENRAIGYVYFGTVCVHLGGREVVADSVELSYVR